MIALAITVYIVGLLILYTWGQLNQGWYDYYYIWDKAKDLLIFIGLYLAVKKQYQWAIKPVIIFSLIRFVWQIISSITGWNINNVKIVGWLFIVLALICSFMTLKELIKWRK